MLRNERGIDVEEFDEEMKGKGREMIKRRRRKEEAMVLGNYMPLEIIDICQTK